MDAHAIIEPFVENQVPLIPTCSARLRCAEHTTVFSGLSVSNERRAWKPRPYAASRIFPSETLRPYVIGVLSLMARTCSYIIVIATYFEQYK